MISKYAPQKLQDPEMSSEYYSRVFDYDPANTSVRAELAEVYMEMWRASVRRGQPELIAAYARNVADYAGTEKYQSSYRKEIDGDGKLVLNTGDVKARDTIHSQKRL